MVQQFPNDFQPSLSEKVHFLVEKSQPRIGDVLKERSDETVSFEIQVHRIFAKQEIPDFFSQKCCANSLDFNGEHLFSKARCFLH